MQRKHARKGSEPQKISERGRATSARATKPSVTRGPGQSVGLKPGPNFARHTSDSPCSEVEPKKCTLCIMRTPYHYSETLLELGLSSKTTGYPPYSHIDPSLSVDVSVVSDAGVSLGQKHSPPYASFRKLPTSSFSNSGLSLETS